MDFVWGSYGVILRVKYIFTYRQAIDGLDIREMEISRMVAVKILSRCIEIQIGNGVNGPTKEKESSSLSGQSIFILNS